MKNSCIRIHKTGLPNVGGVYVWGAVDAIRVARANADLDYSLEQYCRTCAEYGP